MKTPEDRCINADCEVLDKIAIAVAVAFVVAAYLVVFLGMPW